MTAALCPCCGAEVAPSRLLVDLNTNKATRLGVTVCLEPAEAEILSVVAAAFPSRVLKSRLIAAVYGAGDEPDSAANIVSVRVSRMRARLALMGVTIPAGYGGYRLEVADGPVAYVPDSRSRGREWSDVDVGRLRAAWAARSPVKAIAARLGRTVTQVRQKAWNLGLARRRSEEFLAPGRKTA